MLEIEYYSDVLCIWAYASEARLEELEKEFSDKISIKNRYISLFGNNEHKMANYNGGAEGFNKHVLSVASRFDYLDVNPDIWVKTFPKSSAPAHLYLKAVDALFSVDSPQKDLTTHIAKQIREAFFVDAKDISDMRVLDRIMQANDLDTTMIKKAIEDGSALSDLMYDTNLKERNKIDGSPTFLFNHGRLKLYGNVGYKLIKANVEEVLNLPEIKPGTMC